MGEGAKQSFQGVPFGAIDASKARCGSWMTMGGDSESSGASSFGDSENSVESSSSSDLVEDASSSSFSSASSSSSLNSNGSLYDLSDLMAHLPIKKGLSKYFQGKSQSFTSLASVRSIEDLAKRVCSSSCRKKMKSCNSYGGGLDGQRLHSPKATISKKIPRGYSLSSMGRRAQSNIAQCRPPAPLQRI